ncbi:helix-turn-helix transcriptional regulator (plasmid) [Adhaeribacter swui]|uniref:Helix-turn-helix transcriptional regulator n=1 Tax=Adhaeribacter swui TaxID=2086471 RepID=A0A7G7G2H4_9BACT|nr:helix-turn-helix transcriptional regulator [Adhaeribacter swui]QNF31358.1 helix-turn-helix transcriptional regulator [Adhaeribacter swui]
MKLTLPEIGERLQTFRKTLGFTQKDIAESLNVQQNAISRFEKGSGGSLELLLDLVNYFDGHFLAYSLFADQFEVIKRGEDVPGNTIYNKIALERLKVLKNDLAEKTEEVAEIINLMETKED